MSSSNHLVVSRLRFRPLIKELIFVNCDRQGSCFLLVLVWVDTQLFQQHLLETKPFSCTILSSLIKDQLTINIEGSLLFVPWVFSVSFFQHFVMFIIEILNIFGQLHCKYLKYLRSFSIFFFCKETVLTNCSQPWNCLYMLRPLIYVPAFCILLTVKLFFEF